jgi:hypothetical protein
VASTPEGTVNVRSTVAPFVNPEIVQENQPNGVVVPFGMPPGAVAVEKLVNVPALVVAVKVPCVVTTLQVAPLQLVIAGVELWPLHAASTHSGLSSARRARRRSGFARTGH